MVHILWIMNPESQSSCFAKSSDSSQSLEECSVQRSHFLCVHSSISDICAHMVIPFVPLDGERVSQDFQSISEKATFVFCVLTKSTSILMTISLKMSFQKMQL